MNPKEHMRETCLLGSERRSIDENELPEGIKNIIAAKTFEDEAEKALTTLSLWNFYNQAGSAPAKVKSSINLDPIVEDKAYASEKLSTALGRILELDNQNTQDTLINIWIDKAIANNQIVPTIYCVPYLRYVSYQKKAIKKKATATFGKKGKWLIELDESLDKLRIEEEEQHNDWPFGNKKERQKFIIPLLRHQPEQAFEVIKDHWSGENMRDKLWILQLIKEYHHSIFNDFMLSLYEEEFAYKGKETKTARNCRAILAQYQILTESTGLHQKTITALKKYITAKGNIISRAVESISTYITIPSEEDDFFNAENMLSVYGMDMKDNNAANYKNNQIYCFSSLLSAIPFKIWKELTKASYKQLATFFFRDKQFNTTGKNSISDLQDALIDLAYCSQDDEMTMTILPFIYYYENKNKLIATLSPKAWEKTVLQHNNWSEVSMLEHGPVNEDGHWSSDFSKKLLIKAKELVNQKGYWYDYQFSRPCIKYLSTDAIATLVSLNNSINPDAKEYWDRHVYQPIMEGLSIKNLIEQS